MESTPSSLYRVISRQFPSAHPDDVVEAIREAVYVAFVTVRERCLSVYNVDAFMTTVAKRSLSRELRRQRRMVRPDNGEHITWDRVESERAEPLDQESAHATVIDATDIMQAMPPTYAEVMRLYYLEGLTHEQVAERIGISHACVRKRHERAIKWARKTFGE